MTRLVTRMYTVEIVTIVECSSIMFFKHFCMTSRSPDYNYYDLTCANKKWGNHNLTS